jgi:pimeloyl-ACP methyl ester carboxylesterase
VLALLLAALLVGCDLGGGDHGERRSGGRTQSLRWHTCEGFNRCARLTVPLDWEHPGGRTISLAVMKVPALHPRGTARSLVVNPGGPGVSGVDFASYAESAFGPDLLARYDVVGFDPRGVARSAPVRCLPQGAMNRFLAADPNPVGPAAQRRWTARVRHFGRECLRRSGRIARHVSTADTVRDLDALRSALGERRLSYLGKSYGTYLGASYAARYPEHVGRLVLDGAVDPRLSTSAFALAQARATERELRAFVRDCVARGVCSLGSSVPLATARIGGLLARLGEAPLRVGSRQVSQNEALSAAVYGLAVPGGWGRLETALTSAREGDGRAMVSLADESLDRAPDGSFRDNVLQANPAVFCLDHDDAPTPQTVGRRLLSRFEAVAPTFAAWYAWPAAACSQWPVHSGHQPRRLDVRGIPRALVVATTGDPLTPPAFGRGLVEQLDRSVMLLRRGHGHTAYTAGNECVDRAVDRYLLEGALPRQGTVC